MRTGETEFETFDFDLVGETEELSSDEIRLTDLFVDSFVNSIENRLEKTLQAVFHRADSPTGTQVIRCGRRTWMSPFSPRLIAVD